MLDTKDSKGDSSTLQFLSIFRLHRCAIIKVLFGFYLPYSSIKRTVWTEFVMILLNVQYDLNLICKQLNVQVSIISTGFA